MLGTTHPPSGPRCRLAAVLALALVASFGGPAAGAAPNIPREKRTKAKALFERAEKAYYLGRFEKALKLYSAAYEAAPLPGFLYNIGQCHRMLKNYERAIFFYKGYLQATDTSNQQAVVRLIRKLEKKLQEKPARRAAPARRRLAAPPGSGATRPPYLPPRDQTPPEPPVTQRWWFWTAIGGGAALVAAAVVGGVLGARARSDSGTGLPAGSLGTLDRR
jgi:hypothetical protein